MSASLVRSRVLVTLAIALGIAVALSLWSLHDNTASAEVTAGVKAIRGDLVVSVRGVGRIVQTQQSGLTTAPPAGASSGSSATAEVAGAPVYARTSGQIAKVLVAPGQRVKAGQALALLDDAGTSGAAIRQAQIDRAIAELELRQKRTSDPVRGIPATRAELIAGGAAVTAAKSRLARLLAPPRKADVSTARTDVRRAVADLEALRGGTPEARAEAIRLGKEAVQLAEQRLARVLAPPAAADVAAVQLELKKAESDLASIQRPNVTPAPEALLAAQNAIGFARSDLAHAMRENDLDLIREAQDRLDSALVDLGVLLRPGAGALPEQINSAKLAVDAAKLKLERMLMPANPADVTAARAELDRAKADLRARRAGPSRAAIGAGQQTLAAAKARLAQLLGPPPKSDVTTARQDVRRAVAELSVLRARGGPASPLDISLSRLRVEAAGARLSAALAARGLLTVRSLVGGTVLAVTVGRGAHVDPTTPIATVADLDRLAASVDLSEFDAARVTRGLKAAVSVDALGGKRLPGRVSFAALAGQSTPGGLVTFPVRVALPHSKSLKPGMNVSVRIVVARRNGVVQVPLEAVTTDDEDRPIVTVLNGSGEGVARRVTVGLANNEKIEIRKGLRPGERVAVEAPAAQEEE